MRSYSSAPESNQTNLSEDPLIKNRDWTEQETSSKGKKILTAVMEFIQYQISLNEPLWMAKQFSYKKGCECMYKMTAIANRSPWIQVTPNNE